MRSKHTPGPWDNIEDTDGSILIKTQGHGSFRQIAVIPSDSKVTEYDWANADLISASPEMLVALERIEVMLSAHKDNDYQFMLTLITPAIRKAKGG